MMFIYWNLLSYYDIMLIQSDFGMSREWSGDCPFVRKGAMPMSIMEVLQLLLVVFAALTYIDNHRK